MVKNTVIEAKGEAVQQLGRGTSLQRMECCSTSTNESGRKAKGLAKGATLSDANFSRPAAAYYWPSP